MATERLSLADDTTDVQFASATLSLYREAIQCLVAALEIMHDPVAPKTPMALPNVTRQLDELVRKGLVPTTPGNYSSVLQLVDEPAWPPPHVDQRTAAEQREQLERLAHWLESHVQARTRWQLLTTRVTRLSLALAVILGASWWVIDAVFAPTNVALHKPVTLSGRYPGTPDPQGATDGKVVGPYQAHTPRQDDPWLTIDLGRTVPVGRVVIHNRTDGLFADALPLTLELSQDGTHFEQVDRRTEAFTGSRPWVFERPARPTRALRVHGHQSGYVVVTEVEAYER